jgi:hypothetical protein
MALFEKRITRVVLGLALCLIQGLSAPATHPQTAAAHSATAHPSYYVCSKYYSSYWGYSFGYYKGTEVTDELQSHDGYDGYNYGTKWYLGYYPDSQYWTFYNEQPAYVYKYYNSYKYRCFTPYQSAPSPTPTPSY